MNLGHSSSWKKIAEFDKQSWADYKNAHTYFLRSAFSLFFIL